MRLILIAALALPIAATAQTFPQGGRPGMRAGDGGGGKRPATFISPVGKPYRNAPGEPYAIVKWFKAIDTSHDGYVTADEFVKEAENFFVELDIDKDGEITPDEITRYEQQIAPEVQSGIGGFGGMGGGGGPGMRHGGGGKGRRGGGGGGGGSSGGREGMPDEASGESEGGSRGSGGRPMGEMPKGAAMYGLLGLPEPVIAADTNFNRGVSLDEMRAAARRRFSEIDTTGKGRLTLGDLPQTPVERSMGLKRQ